MSSRSNRTRPRHVDGAKSSGDAVTSRSPMKSSRQITSATIPAILSPARGPEDVKRIVTMLRTMLPNIKIEVEAMVAEGDMVSAATPRPRLTRRVTWACRRPAKAIRTPAIQMFRFANGKIVESWAVRDNLGTRRQLGHAPAMPARR